MNITGKLSALILIAGACLAQSPQTFTGQIMDSSCAKSGTHSRMEKEHNIKSDKACTFGCVKAGGKFVLYDDASKTTYALDDQSKPAALAGQKATVKGTLDPATNTIHVQEIHQQGV